MDSTTNMIWKKSLRNRDWLEDMKENNKNLPLYVDKAQQLKPEVKR